MMLKVSLIAVSFLAIAPYAIPVHLDRVRLAIALRRMSMAERHVTLFAPWYAEAIALRRRVPPEQAIDFVMVTPRARDVAVLAGALLSPRDVRFFDGWASWRSRERAAFLHAGSAVNAAPGHLPSPAAVVVVVDPDATPPLRVVPAPQ